MSNEHVHPIFQTILAGIAPPAEPREKKADAHEYTDEELAELEALDSLGDPL